MPLITRSEWLDIDDIPFATPAGEVRAGGLLPLLQGPDVRGSNRIIPGAGGVRRNPRRATESRRAIPLVIFADTDPEGVPHADPAIGLVANIDYYRAVTDPTGVGDGTRTATVHLKDGSTRSGPVHVEALELGGDDNQGVLAVLVLTLPDGALVPDGS